MPGVVKEARRAMLQCKGMGHGTELEGWQQESHAAPQSETKATGVF